MKKEHFILIFLGIASGVGAWALTSWLDRLLDGRRSQGDRDGLGVHSENGHSVWPWKRNKSLAGSGGAVAV